MVGMGVLMMGSACSACGCAGAARSMNRVCCMSSRSRWRFGFYRGARRLDHHRDRTAAVHGVRTVADGRLRSPLAAPAVASSLIAFAIVYFAVFSAGVIYLLRLMAAPPHRGEAGPSSSPARAAGITPAAGAAVEGVVR